ncbi:hypothetical protein J4Q44_G00234000 [Coregonus suidteri]|uniref:Uncharacterized protein n=1 Tax=Coregonus suidteri TaxID=861788 RepID=A0AAN8LGY3_9TELE
MPSLGAQNETRDFLPSAYSQTYLSEDVERFWRRGLVTSSHGDTKSMSTVRVKTNGENVLLHQGPLIPSTLMAFQVQPTEKGTLPPTQDIHNKELQMFGIEMRAHVLKLVQRLMQAQQTAKTTLDQPANASVGQFLCSWIRSILKTNSENGANDMPKSDMKTVELLKKAEDHLNEVFEVRR